MCTHVYMTLFTFIHDIPSVHYFYYAYNCYYIFTTMHVEGINSNTVVSNDITPNRYIPTCMMYVHITHHMYMGTHILYMCNVYMHGTYIHTCVHVITKFMHFQWFNVQCFISFLFSLSSSFSSSPLLWLIVQFLGLVLLRAAHHPFADDLAPSPFDAIIHSV